MKQVVFLGVGEACDPNLPNTSLVVRLDSGGEILGDCGFTAAHTYFAHTSDPEALRAVWVSHFHGDHLFGLPLLLLRLREMGRQKELIIAGPTGIEERVLTLVRLAYGFTADMIGFRVRFQEVSPGRAMEHAGWSLCAAEVCHSRPACAVRIEEGGHSLYFSGDGRPTEECLVLAANVDLMVHEMYGLDQAPDNHGTCQQVVEFAVRTNASALALVHLSWRTARRRSEVVKRAATEKNCRVFVPRPGESFTFI